MMDTIVIKEYDELHIKDKRDITKNAISKEDAISLQSIIMDEEPVFKWGFKKLIAQHWVGTISLGDLNIEILPKLYGYVSEASMNDALLKDPDWVHTFKNSALISSMFTDYLPNTYWQYYLMPDSIVDYMDINNTRGMQVINGREKRIFKAAEDIREGKPVDLQQFYVGVHGKFIVKVVESLIHDERSRQLVIVPNNGAIENLSVDATVEIPGYVTDRGVEPVRVGSIPRFYKGLIEQQDACEGLLVEAAIEHSYEKALMAFTMNRTIPSSLVAKKLLDDMIEANKGYWPELK